MILYIFTNRFATFNKNAPAHIRWFRSNNTEVTYSLTWKKHYFDLAIPKSVKQVNIQLSVYSTIDRWIRDLLFFSILFIPCISSNFKRSQVGPKLIGFNLSLMGSIFVRSASKYVPRFNIYSCLFQYSYESNTHIFWTISHKSVAHQI